MSGYIKWATPLATATEIAHSQWSREVKNAKTLFTWWKRQYPTSTRQDWLFYSGRQDVRLPKVTTEDIVQLQQAKGTTLQYIVSPDRPTVDSPFGKVQLGSILSYQARNLRKIKSVNISPTSSCGDLNVINPAPVKLPLQYEHLKSEYYEENPRLLEQSTKSQALSGLWV
ncbi:hypothetical protein ACF0H5_006543 [Mactra antiquata]